MTSLAAGDLYETSGDIFASLEFLHQPWEWIEQASEAVEIRESELVRHVEIRILIPLAVPAFQRRNSRSLTEFHFVALRPRKGELVTIEPLLAGTSGDPNRRRRMSHDEHLTFSRLLIFHRVLSLCGHLLGKNHTVRSGASTASFSLDAAVTDLVTSLIALPALPVKQALDLLKRYFDDHGNLKILEEHHRNSHEEARLFRLCTELAERYYIVLVSPAQLGGRLEFHYRYRQQFYERKPRLPDQIKRYLGAQPAAFRIHVPLARMCDHYDIQMPAPTGFYFYEQRLLKAVQVEQVRGRSPVGYESVESGDDGVMVAREIGGGTLAHMFIGSGRQCGSSVYVGLRTFEVPPGTTGLSCALLVFGLVLCTGFHAWQQYFDAPASSADAAALIVGISALAPAAMQYALPRSRPVDVPVMSRLYLLGQSIAMVTFALWLLIQQSTVPPGAYIPEVLKWWQRNGGAVVLVGLAVATVHGIWRLVVSTRTHARVLQRATQNRSGGW